jgi:hypothetical protein
VGPVRAKNLATGWLAHASSLKWHADFCPE